MNMNREAVNAALSYAGNQELTDTDKQYNNSVYRICKNLYMPTLFNSLTELDWKCARKYTKLYEAETIMYKMAGVYYYETPADCIKPIHVDDNKIDFRVDADYIITSSPASQLYYVFHNRNFVLTPRDTNSGFYPASIKAPDNLIEAQKFIKSADEEGTDDDFPEWDYTPYDADFWQFFSYKLAAELIPILRSDDGTHARAQAMTALAEQIGSKAVLREKESETNKNVRPPTWSEKLGVRSSYNGGGYGRRSI